MTDATGDFFQKLAHRHHDRRLQAIDHGSVRFDISDRGRARHWLVRIARGRIWVAQVDSPRGGDAVVEADSSVFDRIARGEAYFLTTVLRGEATVIGSPHLFATVRKLFPPPPYRHADETERSGGSHE
ncbi:SCP2 sterol-binding domain-containing protein [Micromonospora tulbaghiae]|uniref:SCP2 sterol-binding domain-containing protein n=1 Tax=Micromonospora tulbaghiae TaxID=479978 RepID=UPI0033EAC121